MKKNAKLPKEQKGCYMKCRGTNKDQLLIDKMIMKNWRRHQTGLAMCDIDYKKAYDMLPRSCIMTFIEIVKVADNMRSAITKSMKNRNTHLTDGGTTYEI